eukprot:scaffold24788_cov117-Cylindrotheca_fusiformis.AAC.5
MSRSTKRSLDRRSSTIETEKRCSEKISQSAMPFAAQSSVSKGAQDGDSDIEFLLTIQPPSPAKKRRSDRDKVSLQSSLQPSSSASSRSVTPDENDSKLPPHQQQEEQLQGENSLGVLESSAPSRKVGNKKGHTWRRSAYLQSLAEICHAMLWDARWRAGEEQLFSWERGDDLSAVHALARRFIPLAMPAPKSCHCHVPDCPVRQSAIASSAGDSSTKVPSDDASDPNDESEDEEAYDRSLNLYCRLYFRKGPFFRVDDLYSKYYSLKQGESTTPVEHQPPSPTRQQKRTNFFLPKAKGVSKKSRDKFIDSDLLQKQMDGASLLIEDLQRLSRMGLFATFADEEECGKTVGEVKKHGLLRQNEQVQILQLLGCKKSRTSPKNGENLVWKQMSQQQSISNMAAANVSQLLPVINHVDETLLESWATNIVLKSSKIDYVPTSTLRSFTEMVKTELLHMIGPHPFATCVRHREAPLKAVRRCCRLYLCATSGPGSMRGDGATAWKSLPDSHSKDLSKLPFTKMIPPPGSHCWHSIAYPGKDHRFRLRCCNFIRAHEPLFLYDANRHRRVHNVGVSTVEGPANISYRLWRLTYCDLGRLTTEVRAYVDYLIELRETLRYNDRRRAKNCDTEDTDSDDIGAPEHCENDKPSVDFFDLLTGPGRERFARRFFVDIAMLSYETRILSEIEKDATLVETGFAGVENFKLHTECDNLLAMIAVICLHVLAACCQHANREKIQLAARRPWLRHLRWEGCLAYVLWDAIRTLECRMTGFYELAVKALGVLLFGKLHASSSLFPPEIPTSPEPNLADFLLSRRARGKAYERLAIDCLHVLRLRHPKKKAGSKPSGKRKAKKQLPKAPSPTELVATFSKALLMSCVPKGRVPFSAIRTLAKRIKQPLSTTLLNMTSPETTELGHRYSNATENRPAKNENRYSEWEPLVDETVAMALARNDEIIGKRCSYIGFEDEENDAVDIGSMSVEQLAKEYYKSGRLPANDISPVRGGWVGWHDEGGRVRQLWRILSSGSVLGMDFGCTADWTAGNPQESVTIYMTPYQSAPFDLHCGAELDGKMVPGRAFFERRRGRIESFLKHLRSLQPSEVADLVYHSVEARFNYIADIEYSDPTLGRDVQQLRSLSLLAAALGGEMLSAIFRCFFFDYRHYSGGLPDLTLVRALSEGELVNLGDWIGEGFASGTEEGADILEDRDSEFLGCSKVGDSGASKVGRFARRQGQLERNNSKSATKEQLELPSRLELSYMGNPVTVECMFSEVKSHNDRLDARQEDWLNILDKFGNARVCKFRGKGKKDNTTPSGAINPSTQ